MEDGLLATIELGGQFVQRYAQPFEFAKIKPVDVRTFRNDTQRAWRRSVQNSCGQRCGGAPLFEMADDFAAEHALTDSVILGHKKRPIEDLPQPAEEFVEFKGVPHVIPRRIADIDRCFSWKGAQSLEQTVVCMFAEGQEVDMPDFRPFFKHPFHLEPVQPSRPCVVGNYGDRSGFREQTSCEFQSVVSGSLFDYPDDPRIVILGHRKFDIVDAEEHDLHSGEQRVLAGDCETQRVVVGDDEDVVWLEMNEFLVERFFDIGFPLRIVESLAVHKLDIKNVTP